MKYHLRQSWPATRWASRRKQGDRRGAISVEMAVALPVLFLVIFGSLEFSRMNMIRHTVDNAAYEAARRAIVPGATAEAVEDKAQRLLQTVAVTNGEVAIDPPVLRNDTPEVRVTVTVPATGNGFIAPHFFAGKTFVGSCRLTREEL